MGIDMAFVWRFLHVTAAVAWFGGGAYYLVTVSPRIRALAGRARYEAHRDQQRRHMPFFIVAGFVTIAAGFLTANEVFGSFNPSSWGETFGSTGQAIAWGMYAGVVALLTGPLHGVAKKRLDEALEAEWNPDSEAGARRAATMDSTLTLVGMLLLTVSMVLMVGAHTNLLG